MFVAAFGFDSDSKEIEKENGTQPPILVMSIFDLIVEYLTKIVMKSEITPNEGRVPNDVFRSSIDNSMRRLNLMGDATFQPILH